MCEGGEGGSWGAVMLYRYFSARGDAFFRSSSLGYLWEMKFGEGLRVRRYEVHEFKTTNLTLELALYNFSFFGPHMVSG